MRFTAAALGATLMLASGCQPAGSSPNLLNLSGLSPQQVDVGDQLEIFGAGFPEGKPAQIAFLGDLYRPATAPQRGVEIQAQSSLTSGRTVSLTVDDSLQAAFCGEGDDSRHTTFRGQVVVSFSPHSTGAPPVRGRLADVVLDVQPRLPSSALQRLRTAEARAATAFLGITLAKEGGVDCCVISQAAGRAAAVGLQPGDNLVEMDGLTIQSPEDLIPSGRSRTARLSFSRAGVDSIVTREIDVQGFRSAAPSELGPAVALVAFAMGLLLLFVTRLRVPLVWLERGLAAQIRRRSMLGGWGSRAAMLGGRLWAQVTDEHLPEHALVRLMALLAFVGITSLCTLLAFGVELISFELDLAGWWLATTLIFALAGMLQAACEPGGNLWRGLAGAGRCLLHQIPSLGLLLATVMTAESVRVIDIVDAQQGTLPHWFVFRDPALLLLVCMTLISLVAEFSPRASVLPGIVASGHGQTPTAARPSLEIVAFLGGTVRLWLQATLLSALVFGGWQIPVLGARAPGTSLGWQLLGALLFLAKSWAVVGFIGLVRWVTSGLTLRETAPWMLRWGLATTALAVVLSRLWTLSLRRWALGWLEPTTRWVLLAVVLTALVLAAARLIRQGRSTRNELGLNPWL